MKKQNIIVTGASSGIGRLTALLLSKKGHNVFGTFRKLTDDSDNLPFNAIVMDVDSDESVNTAVAGVIQSEGRLHGVANCAGYGIAGAIEETDIDEAKAQFETNFFGVIRVCNAVLPHMREHGNGRIVNVSSLGGMVSAPFHGLYCASKFAVEGMTEALRMEVAQFGVHVSLVEPGDFKTRFTQNRKITRRAKENSAYEKSFRKSLEVMEKAESEGPEPDIVAETIAKIFATPKPRPRYLVAPGIQSATPVLKTLLPGRLFEKAIMDHFEIG